MLRPQAYSVFLTRRGGVTPPLREFMLISCTVETVREPPLRNSKLP
jgi:hypothetical protein